MMQRLLSRVKTTAALFVVAALLVPSALQATSADELITTADGKPVSRGDFIRAAVMLLSLENTPVDESEELPYRRVARGYEPYVRVAHEKDALVPFGFDLLLAQGISRGDALQVLVNLTGYDTAEPAPFNDAKVGTPEERAVRVAIQRNWMEPLRDNLFGVRRMLTGSDARLLLHKVTGESGVQQQAQENNTPTITINYTNKRLNNLPKTQILEAIWNVVQQQYLYDDQINPDEAAWKAAEGMIESLGDKYTTFMRPARSEAFQTQIQGEVSGIGAQVEMVDDMLTIVSPIVGSPAEAAGLKPGDQILKADGVSLDGLNLTDAVNKVRGPVGSTVNLTIRRNGNEFDVSVRRDVIKVPEDIITWNDDVAVVQIVQFGRITQNDLRAEMQNINNKNPEGIIVDLRNNPGGLLDAAATVVGFFVPKGSAVAEIRSRNGDRTQSTTQEPVINADIPVIILVNDGSASASEIVAGALQDHGRATVVGTKTFGKGTVQQVLQFNDSSALKVTIAEWFTPNGRKIDSVGIEPDIYAEEEENADRDAPMVRALELLR